MIQVLKKILNKYWNLSVHSFFSLFFFLNHLQYTTLQKLLFFFHNPTKFEAIQTVVCVFVKSLTYYNIIIRLFLNTCC